MLLCDSSKLTRVGCICPYIGDEALTWTQAAPLTGRPTGQNIRAGKINNQWNNFTAVGSFMLPVLGLVKSVLDDTGLEVCLKKKKENEKKKKEKGSAVVRALASHQCGPGSNLASTPCVGWVRCWFSPLLREVFLRVLRFSPLLKNQHFQIPIRSGTHGHVSTRNYNYKIRLFSPNWSS